MHIKPEIELTGDGSPTLLHPVLGEYYHSLTGAEAESMHVFVGAGFDYFDGDRVRIFEVGFGSGLNAWLTMLRAGETGRIVDYTAVELYPVAEQTISALPYACDERFVAMHCAEWGKYADITTHFRLLKLEADLLDVEMGDMIDVIYFDAFAPDSQPELWSAQVFGRLFSWLTPGGALVTYSAKGDVKRALREAGFEVRRLTGAPGKRHMIRAYKPPL